MKTKEINEAIKQCFYHIVVTFYNYNRKLHFLTTLSWQSSGDFNGKQSKQLRGPVDEGPVDERPRGSLVQHL